ncbi:multidrug resistance protein EbrB [Mesobacillus persicus]|uniref:Multidrug resistance protein EbrB n=1 Tax=Mesobacillus persicus TaxID=930146 RepID=A0A1H8D4A7_9BACI|nr:multidrug efflux SMR transporter [Mesobacillus persicus]SEN02029.1 multidrug resistance protein EbrB [Mesobacillus persicus]
MKGVIYLTISIITEVFATTMLKLSEGFTNLYPTLGLMFGYAISFYFLSLCLRTLPLSLAYAIWAAGGTVLTALLGVVLWGEAVTTLKSIGLLMIIGGVIILNSTKEVETGRVPSAKVS